MAGDRDIVRGSLDTVSDWRLTRPADVTGQATGQVDYVLIGKIVEVDRFEQQASEHVQRLADELGISSRAEGARERAGDLLRRRSRSLPAGRARPAAARRTTDLECGGRATFGRSARRVRPQRPAYVREDDHPSHRGLVNDRDRRRCWHRSGELRVVDNAGARRTRVGDLRFASSATGGVVGRGDRRDRRPAVARFGETRARASSGCRMDAETRNIWEQVCRPPAAQTRFARNVGTGAVGAHSGACSCNAWADSSMAALTRTNSTIGAEHSVAAETVPMDDQRQRDAVRWPCAATLSLRGRRSSVAGDKPGLGDSPFRTHAVTRHTGRDTRAGMDAGLDPRQGHEPAVRQERAFGACRAPANC